MSKTRYDAMMVTEYTNRDGEQKSFWTKIGAAFENKDGSIGVQLDAFPKDGKVILQVPLSKEEREEKFGNREGGRKGGGQRGGGGRRQAKEEPEYPDSFNDHDEPQGGGGFADET